MTDSKTPDWIEAASGDLALDYVDWLGRDKVDPDAEHVLSVSISQALLSAYERGRKEGIEESAKVVDDNMLCSSRSGDEVLLARGSSGNRVGSAYATAIRQLLEGK